MSGYPKAHKTVSLNPGFTMLPKRKATEEELLAIAKATIYGGLDPVDLKRCQGMSRQPLSPFTMGGDIKGQWLRCDRVPSQVAIEPKLSSDKSRGAMSLCRSCAKHCKEKQPETLFTPAAPFKAAYKLGGHQAVKDMVYGFTAVPAQRGARVPPKTTGLRAHRKHQPR